jgi:hypothetical protein
MKSAKDILRGSTVVILNKIEIDSYVAEDISIPGFHEKTTGISKDLGL